ncbi:MAG: TRAP transporter small permease [Comamonadaceae bacterium]|jgi:TRAP-type C4-dicarboxylate transport system permease small subunit|nr:MAG: TRAP transporter small permease [Comamonadaceae bacterium]
MTDPVLESQEARDQGLAPPELDPTALGGYWLNAGLPKLLRDIAAFVFLPLIVVVIAIDVVGRYFFSHPLQWSQEAATLTLLVLFVAAIPFTTASNGHVRTETLYEKYSPRTRALTDAAGSVCGAVFMGVIAYWQFRELPGMIARGEGAEFMDVPYWPISLFVGLCMLFGLVQLMLRAAQRTRDAFSPETRP